MGKDAKRLRKDRNRCKKMGKDAKRWESTAALLENAVFPLLQTRTNSLTTYSPTKDDRGLCQSCFWIWLCFPA